jgi:vesicle-associated membrane protein 4
MDSSSIYYDAAPINGNLRFNADYEEYKSDSPSPEDNSNNNNNDNSSEDTIIEEIVHTNEIYHNEEDDITSNLLRNENNSLFSIELTNSNMIKPEINSSYNANNSVSNNSFSNNPNNPNESIQYASFIKSDINNIRMDLNETEGILRTNIERVANRGLRLEEIEDKASSICSDADEFNTKSRALKRQMWCKNYTVHLFGCMGIFVIVIIVVLSTIH